MRPLKRLLALPAPRPCRLYLAIGLGGIVVFSLTSSASAKSALYCVYGISASLAVVAGVRLHRPSVRAPWLLLAAGLFVWWEGDVAWALQSAWVGGAAADGVAWSDAFWLSAYLLLIGGLIGLSVRWGGSRAEARGSMLDSIQIAIAAALVTWILLIEPAAHRAGSSFEQQVIAGAYPALDVLVLALTLRLVFAAGLRLPSAKLLAGGFLLQFACDIVWRELTFLSDYGVGSFVNAGYLASYLLLGAAGLNASMSRLSRLDVPQRPAMPTLRVVLLGISGLVAPLLLTVDWTRDSTANILFVAAVAAVIAALTIWRFVGLLRSLERAGAVAAHAESQTKAVLEASPAPIALLDPDGVVKLWNRAAERVSGLAADEVIGHQAPLTGAGGDGMVSELRRRIRSREAVSGLELRIVRREGTEADIVLSTAPVDDGGGETSETVASWVDVTERNAQAAQIRYLASHDAVTTLPNRWAFDDYLERTTERSSPQRQAMLLMLDLDNFKLVNDTAGHDQGDRLLTEIGSRIGAVLRPGDFLARVGGDEFAAVVNEVDEASVQEVAERVLQTVADFRFHAGDHAFDITVSIGASIVDGQTGPTDAYARADMALRSAKEQGKNRIVISSAAREGIADLAHENRWAVQIKDAIAERRLTVHLQPIVEIATGKPIRFEALVRMLSRSGEQIMPDAFVPSAERFGLMPQIDRFVLETIIPELCDDPDLRVFVNLSATSFDDDTLLDWIEAELECGGFNPGQLGFEITETTAIRDIARAVERLGVVRELGCPIALDDFGVGFSSFLELRVLPVSFVKIGGTFVRDIVDDPSSLAITRAIFEAARALGKEVIAEEVEDLPTAAALAALGVSYAQGFHWGAAEPYPWTAPGRLDAAVA